MYSVIKQKHKCSPACWPHMHTMVASWRAHTVCALMWDVLGWFKERMLGKASHRKLQPQQLITSCSSFPNISEGKKVTYKLLWWAGWWPSRTSSSDDADFHAFPHLVTSFRSWMGQTGRANKHNSHLCPAGHCAGILDYFSPSLWICTCLFSPPLHHTKPQ